MRCLPTSGAHCRCALVPDASCPILSLRAGSRMLAVLLAPLVMPLPLVPHLLAQLYSVAMIGNNRSLCSSPLLAHPTSANRIRLFHHLMSFAASPSCAQPADVLLRNSSQHQQCCAFVGFLGLLLGLVCTTVGMVKLEMMSAVGGVGGGAAGAGAVPATSKSGSLLERSVRQLAGRSWFPAAAVEGATTQAVRRSDGGASLAAEGDVAALAPNLTHLPRPVLWWLLLCWVWIVVVALS